MAEDSGSQDTERKSNDSDTPQNEGSDDTATVSSGPRFNVNVPGGPALSFTNDAQKVIVITVTAIVLISVVETVHQAGQKAAPTPVGQQIAHEVIGGFVAGTLLLGLSYILPEFASGLGIVALVATILDKGKLLGNTVGAIVKTPPPSTPQKGS